jgi:hypothetical protein
MDVAGDDFLAGAGFAQDHHRGFGGRNALDQGPDPRNAGTPAYQMVK